MNGNKNNNVRKYGKNEKHRKYNYLPKITILFQGLPWDKNLQVRA
jgi:hypothetical protein